MNVLNAYANGEATSIVGERRREVSDPRAALDGWYLRGGLRALWQLPLWLGGLLLLALLLLRGLAEDPHENLRVSRARLKALQPPEVPDEENAALVIQTAMSAKVRYTGPLKYDPDMSLDKDSKTFEQSAVQQYFSANAGVIRQLLAAAEMNQCDFRPDLSRGRYTDLSHMGFMTRAVRLLGATARSHAQAGRHAEAAKALRALFALADKLESNPMGITFMVTAHLRGIGVTILQEVCFHDTPRSLADVAAYRDALPKDRDPFAGVLRAFEGEEALLLFDLDQQAAQRDPVRAFDMDELHWAFVDRPAWDFRVPGIICYGSERRCYLGVFGELRRAFERHQVLYPSGESLNEMIRRHQSGPTVFAWGALRPLVARWIRIVEAEQQLRNAKVALEALCFRIKRGRDPESMDELCSDLPIEIPRDVFHDTPLRILINVPDEMERKYLLFKGIAHVLRIYSLGENGRDDCSRIVWPAFRSRTADEADDLFFCLPALDGRLKQEGNEP